VEASVTDPRVRPLAITIGVVFICSVLSVGQVRYEQQQRRQAADAPSGLDTTDDAPGTTGSLPSASATPSPGAPGAPGASGAPGSVPGKPGVSGAPGTPRITPTIPGSIPTSRPPGTTVQAPDFGLRTQGVTKDSVKIGIDYDKSGCGDSAALAAALGPAVTGDPNKAIDAFRRHINENGGIRGRRLDVVTIDDGGLGCPEKNEAAAIQAVEEHKVFLEIVGIHEVGDAVLKRKVPIWGGRSSKAEQQAHGFGQFFLYQDADADFGNWASFGEHYLKTTNAGGKNPACFLHPDTPDFNNLEKIMVQRMKEQGLAFADFIRYADDASTGQQQATAAVTRMKGKCNQIYFVANNAIALIFFTNAAQQQDFHPLYTFTARTAFVDMQLGGSLAQQDQWENSWGLSTRVPPGQHPKENNCRNIYGKYYPEDVQSNAPTSAWVTVACVSMLTTAEAMNRSIDLTGELTANGLMAGVNAIQRDHYWDAHVPMTYTIPTSFDKPFDFTGYDHQTVVNWSRSKGDYNFPEYPKYWKHFGPNGAGAEDLRQYFDDHWSG
jgi:ABC-type branched-subunit amino acid transport system substrate-binding protein